MLLDIKHMISYSLIQSGSISFKSVLSTLVLSITTKAKKILLVFSQNLYPTIIFKEPIGMRLTHFKSQ